MPRLDELMPTREFVNQNSGAKVTFYKELNFADTMKLAEAKDDYQRTVITLSGLIKSWNYVDENGKDLPINSNSISKLPTSEVQAIMTYLNEEPAKSVEQVAEQKPEEPKEQMAESTQPAAPTPETPVE